MLKTGVMMLKILLCITGINTILYVLKQNVWALVSIRWASFCGVFHMHLYLDPIPIDELA